MRILKPPTTIYDIADGRTTDFKSMKDIPDHRIGKIDSVVFSEEGSDLSLFVRVKVWYIKNI